MTMMMSIFSPFDLLLGEAFGQKITGHWATTAEDRKDVNKRAGEVNPSPPQQKQEEPRPRFAPELDGLHCFESILPY
ncbi:hypothetical protein F511_04509 [Dorcoceras hygrometricum]|uniref:Uncharacterized protein n=1 Tax=Dorcoceras hygrometricum TaxID=472368 RepID=A0A2Z7C8W0_9LAMI|nr:hypothetical protein F511_04509 [Dorcoceras hygrometricum]